MNDNHMNPHLFGEKLRARRKSLGLTQEDLALAIGGTRKLVSALERGTRGSSLEMALLAASELGLFVIIAESPVR